MSKRQIKKQHRAEILLTSLIDVFIVVLIFLLRSLSAEGNLLTSASNLILPMSSYSVSPTQVSLTVIGDGEHITVDDKNIAKVADVRAQDTLIIGSMLEILTKKRDEEKKAEMLGVLEESAGNIVVQFDKNMDYDVVTKVMATCGYAGYNNMKFAVTKRGEE